jgi:hypothetical protein
MSRSIFHISIFHKYPEQEDSPTLAFLLPVSRGKFSCSFPGSWESGVSAGCPPEAEILIHRLERVMVANACFEWYKKNGEVPRTSPFSGVENPPVFLGSFYCRLIVPAFSQLVFSVRQ